MYSPHQLAAGAWNDPPVVRDAPKVFIRLMSIIQFFFYLRPSLWLVLCFSFHCSAAINFLVIKPLNICNNIQQFVLVK